MRIVCIIYGTWRLYIMKLVYPAIFTPCVKKEGFTRVFDTLFAP